MAYITLGQLDNERKKHLMTKTAAAVLNEQNQYPADHKFDIFLSHSYSDMALNHDRLCGLLSLLQRYGHSVYIDWIVDNDLDRSQVNEQNADKIRQRMECSTCLLYATTENSCNSLWIPWELGYMDAKKGRVAILPLLYTQSDYVGQEYLGMYPYIEEANDTAKNKQLWVQKSDSIYVNFKTWLTGSQPSQH